MNDKHLHLRAVACALLFAAALVTSTSSCRAEPPPKQVTIAEWNAENLFDTEDDPLNAGDDEFTESSWRRWTTERYTMKLEHLASVIAQMSPDILCLAEIENRRVLDDLNRVLGDRYKKAFPHILHREGSDHRGIDTAMMTRLDPSGVRWLAPVAGQREVIVATFRQDGPPLVVVANHWKSHWGPAEEADRIRATEAEMVRSEIDRILKQDPATAVVVAGDFNDDYDATVMRDQLRSNGCRPCVVSNQVGELLYNLHDSLPADQRGTIFYQPKNIWNSFDSISLSRSLLPECPQPEGWRLKAGSYEVVRLPGMLDDAGHPKPFRLLRNAETRRLEMSEGYSDHLPVRVVLERP